MTKKKWKAQCSKQRFTYRNFGYTVYDNCVNWSGLHYLPKSDFQKYIEYKALSYKANSRARKGIEHLENVENNIKYFDNVQNCAFPKLFIDRLYFYLTGCVREMKVQCNTTIEFSKTRPEKFITCSFDNPYRNITEDDDE